MADQPRMRTGGPALDLGRAPGELAVAGMGVGQGVIDTACGRRRSPAPISAGQGMVSEWAGEIRGKLWRSLDGLGLPALFDSIRTPVAGKAADPLVPRAGGMADLCRPGGG